MDWLNKIRKWPIKKKRIFSVSFAIFFTILIIILNYNINLTWKNEPNNHIYDKNSPISTIQESLSKIFDQAKPALDQIFGTSTGNLSISSTSTENAIDQINSTSSSFDTSSNIVE